MKVCIVVENSFQFDVRAYKEAKAIASFGYDTLVIAKKTDAFPWMEKKDGFTVKRVGGEFFVKRWLKNLLSSQPKQSASDSVSDNVTIAVSLNSSGNVNILKLLWWWFSFRLILTRTLISEKSDIYYAHAPGTLVCAYLAARIRGAKLVYDAHELYSAMDSKTPVDKVIHKISVFVEKVFVSKADAVVTVSDTIATEMQRRFNIRKPLVLINCPYFKVIKRSNKLRDKLGISENQKIVLYQGASFVPNRGLEQLIEAAQFIENSVIVFLGTGPLKLYLEEKVKKHNLKQKVKFLDAVPPRELLEYTSSADIGVNLVQNTCINFYYSLPNKIFEYFMAGAPVIVSNFPEMSRIVNESRAGVCVDPSNIREIAAAINMLATDAMEYARMHNAAMHVARKYNWDNEAIKLKSLIEGLFLMHSKRKNILYIENGLGFGGAVICLAACVRTLNRDKYKPIILSSHNDLETWRSIRDVDSIFIYVKQYRRPVFLKKIIASIGKTSLVLKKSFLLAILPIETALRIPLLLRMLTIVKKYKVDIVHLNNNIDANIEGVITAKLCKIPCVAHIRGSEYNSAVIRFLAKYVNHFIAVSEYVKKSILDMGVPSNKITVIYDGITSDEYERKNALVPSLSKFCFRRYNVGLFACLLEWKGHKVFIEAISILVNEHNLKDCNFFIVGDMPDGQSNYKKELKDIIENYNLGDYVIFTGYQADVFQLMEKMDIIVHTSIQPEPFGRVIIEAMSVGRPVIATGLGGPLEIIQNGVNGILIPPNEPRMLADAVINLLNDEDAARILSINAKKTVEQKFNMQTFARMIEKVFEEVSQCV